MSFSTVLYRTGGTANFQWHHTLGFSREDAGRMAAEVERQGYTTRIEDYDEVVVHAKLGTRRDYDGELIIACASCGRTENIEDRAASLPLCGDCAEDVRIMVAEAREEFAV